MRFSIVSLVCIMLLVLVLFVPAAGAIYVEGQPIPDDGQVHILSADAGTATSDAMMPGDGTGVMYAPNTAMPYNGGMSLVSGMYPGMIATSPISTRDYCPSKIPVAMPVMPAELQRYDPKYVTRVCDGISPAIKCFPEVCVPKRQSPCVPDMVVGNSIGHYTAPSMPGYWNNIDPSSMYTNMPIM